MREINADTAAAYLREIGRVPERGDVRVRELSGGVSNIVLRVDVDVDDEPSFVIKQCRERLRVAMEWHAPLDRIWVERSTLDLLAAILPDGAVPGVLFEDRDNYLFAMTCAPDDAVTWKTQLMAGQIVPDVAARLGTLLARIHHEAPNHPELERELHGTSLFEQLRVDPYYRTAARAHPDLAPELEALIQAMNRPASERTLVLGDFSPKNILVHAGGLILLDFECAHAGDATFDLGFFLSHLLLKAVHASAWGRDRVRAAQYLGLTEVFWDAYLEQRGLAGAARAQLIGRSIQHVAACCLARVDGKSPVEYLDARGQAVARAFARRSILAAPATWDELCLIFKGAIGGDPQWPN